MGELFALVTAMSWGAYNLCVRRGMEAMDGGAGYVITLILGTVANAALLLLPLPGRGAVMAGSSALFWFILAGFSTTLLGRWVYFKNVALLGPSRASAWKNASPIYTLFLGFFLLGERPGLLAALGTAAVVIGLLFMSREKSQSMNEIRSSGKLRQAILLGVATGLAFSAGMLLRKAGLNLWPDAAAGSAIGGAAAMCAYMPFAAARGEVAALRKASWAGVIAFVGAGLFSTLAQLFTFLSLRVSAAVTTQVIAAMEPLFTMLFSVMLLKRKESLTAHLLGSAALICLGVVLVSLKR